MVVIIGLVSHDFCVWTRSMMKLRYCTLLVLKPYSVSNPHMVSNPYLVSDPQLVSHPQNTLSCALIFWSGCGLMLVVVSMPSVV